MSHDAANDHCVCPWWLGYFLLSPLRRLVESPAKLLGPLVREGMTVVEPGCGMGYFTLDLARMVGPQGRVVALDIQERMLAALRRRARRAGLEARIDTRLILAESLGIGDLAGRTDFALAMHVAHEVPDEVTFFAELHAALKTGAELLVVEPRGHVTPPEFERMIGVAEQAGFLLDAERSVMIERRALLRKQG